MFIIRTDDDDGDDDVIIFLRGGIFHKWLLACDDHAMLMAGRVVSGWVGVLGSWRRDDPNTESGLRQQRHGRRRRRRRRRRWSR